MSKLTEKQRKQNLFDATWKTAQEMTHPSQREDSEVCLYLASDGNKCFIGARIHPDVYDPFMDDMNGDTGIESLFSKYPQVEKDLYDDGFSTDIDFLKSLQNIHDDSFDNRFQMLRLLGLDYKLIIPEENG